MKNNDKKIIKKVIAPYFLFFFFGFVYALSVIALYTTGISFTVTLVIFVIAFICAAFFTAFINRRGEFDKEIAKRQEKFERKRVR